MCAITELLVSFVIVYVQCLDYSDDETERRAKTKLRMRRNMKDDDSGNIEDDDDSSSNDERKSPQRTAKYRRRKQYVTVSYFWC